MNRHERRKAAAKARRARSDTMGEGYTSAPLPDYVQQHPAFKAGQKAAESGEGFPQAYHDAIHNAARLIVQWVQAEPAEPDLRWVREKNDGVFISAGLGSSEYLADSPDAFRLLAWLDEQTGRQLSIHQARWALRLCRALPMPDGSYHGTETRHESGAYRSLLQMLDRAVNEDDRVPESTCGHCGKHLDGASADGNRPKSGDISVCIYCAGVGKFGEDLRTAPMSDAAIDALPPDTATKIREMQALLRAAISKRLGGKRKGPVGEA